MQNDDYEMRPVELGVEYISRLSFTITPSNSFDEYVTKFELEPILVGIKIKNPNISRNIILLTLISFPLTFGFSTILVSKLDEM